MDHSAVTEHLINHSAVTKILINHSTVTERLIDHSVVTEHLINHSTVTECLINHSAVTECLINHSAVTECLINHSTVTQCSINHSTGTELSPLPRMRRKKLAHWVFHIFATCTGLGYNITDTDCWAENCSRLLITQQLPNNQSLNSWNQNQNIYCPMTSLQ